MALHLLGEPIVAVELDSVGELVGHRGGQDDEADLGFFGALYEQIGG